MRFVMRSGDKDSKRQEHEYDMRRGSRMEHDDDMEMRRGRVRAYDMGYEDARRDAEMRQYRSRMEEEMRRGRRRSRSELDNEHDMRNERIRPEYEPEMRRGRTRSESQPWDKWGDGESESRRIGFHEPEMHHAGEHAKEYMEHGMAETKKHVPMLDEILEEAEGVLENPPQTWRPYLQKHDYESILRMEIGELHAALAEGKSLHDVNKELKHSIAALMQLMIK